MRKVLRGRQDAARCGECGGEICDGESYWQINGERVCADCLPAYSRAELEPFRRVRGKEEGFS